MQGIPGAPGNPGLGGKDGERGREGERGAEGPPVSKNDTYSMLNSCFDFNLTKSVFYRLHETLSVWL